MRSTTGCNVGRSSFPSVNFSSARSPVPRPTRHWLARFDNTLSARSAADHSAENACDLLTEATGTDRDSSSRIDASQRPPQPRCKGLGPFVQPRTCLFSVVGCELPVNQELFSWQIVVTQAVVWGKVFGRGHPLSGRPMATQCAPVRNSRAPTLAEPRRRFRLLSLGGFLHTTAASRWVHPKTVKNGC
jgi:hypothetical protein